MPDAARTTCQLIKHVLTDLEQAASSAKGAGAWWSERQDRVRCVICPRASVGDRTSHIVQRYSAYSPRGVYKGGGKCVKHLVDPRAPAVVDPRSEQSGVPMHDEYRERVVNVEKTREKHKEIQPPMAIPANKPLSCGKFFVSDVISAGSSSPNHTEVETAGARRCPANCPPSPTLKDREEGADEHEDVYERLYQPPRASTAAAEPPSTAEYVKSPRWREPNRRKWVAGSFVTTVASTNVHTAQQRRIDGSASGPTLLIEDKFASTYENPCASPASPAVRAFVRAACNSW
jgi:hypothetical protein